jgi:hypothetical protein
VDAGKLGDLDPAKVASIVRSHLGELKDCFDQALRTNPNLAGKIVLHWTIQSSGSVTAISLESNTVADRAMPPCIQAKLAAWHFPPPTGGAVEVSFPFVFQSSPGPAATSSTQKAATAARPLKKSADPELPVRTRLTLGTDGELVSSLTGVDQQHDGQTPHLEIRSRRGNVGGALTFDFSASEYPQLADVIGPSFFWTVASSFVDLGSKRIARVGVMGRAGEDLMVLQEIVVLVDVDGETPKLLWLGLGDREENTFDACVVTTRATFKLARPGILARTRRSTKWVTRMTDPELDDYRRNCRASPKTTDTFPLLTD